MHVATPHDLATLGKYIPRFLALVGEKRWFKRVDQLDAEQQKSAFQWKIVRDYHWLEFGISFQADVLAKEGRLQPELTDALILAALNFAATTVEVHARLSPMGQRKLEGRLRDGLKAETGYASLYLELDLAQRLMDAGFDVTFSDIEGTAEFDLIFSRGEFTGEVECKSLSADAGRQIHRKDFYRFMHALLPALEIQQTHRRREVLVISLDARLSPNTADQAALLAAARSMLSDASRPDFAGDGFTLERRNFDEAFSGAPVSDTKALYKACSEIFGPNTHVAGGVADDCGCLIVMRSKREDDTSKPMLEGMRKAASQLSGERPAFIAVQDHGIEPADLMLPHVRRRAGILAYALYGHYGASHVNATYVSGFGAVVAKNGLVGAPAFAIPNPKPKFQLNPADAPTFLDHISDDAFAAAIGAPLPAPDISHIPFDRTELENASNGPGASATPNTAGSKGAKFKFLPAVQSLVRAALTRLLRR